MPKVPIDYSKTIIYKIEHIENDNLVYVGHTTNWDKRKTAHKYICKNEKDKKHNLKLYQMIRENGYWELFKMIEVEKYSCKDKREAERRENEVMKKLKANINSMRSFRTDEEKTKETKLYKNDYYNIHKDIIIEKQKVYNETRIDSLKSYKKEYNENNKEKLKEYKKYGTRKTKKELRHREKNIITTKNYAIN